MKKIVGVLISVVLLMGVCSLYGCDGGKKEGGGENNEVFSKINLGLKAPSKAIDVVNFSSGLNSGENMLSAHVLQGVINKKEPRVYIARPWESNGKDVEAKRQDILKTYGKVELNYLPLDSEAAHNDGTAFWTLFKKYSSEIKRMFVFSSNVSLNDTINVATMLAGRNEGIAVSQTLADKINAEGYNIPQINVLEHMGMKASAANYLNINEWIANNMVEGSNKTVVFTAVPRERGAGEKFLPSYYDMVAASDSVIYNAGYSFLDKGVAYQKKILDQYPDCTPVMGWADLNMEEQYVKSVSACGKIIAGADWGYDNGSVWGAFEEYTHFEKISAPPETFATENGKMYVSFMMSDGDAWHFTAGSNIANFQYEQRGTFPMGWSTASMFGVCNPLMLQWYYDNKTANDEFIQGPCGVSYAYASVMPENSYTNFLNITKETFNSVGLSMVSYWDLIGGGGGAGNSLSGDNLNLIQKYQEIVKPDAIFRGHNSITGDYQMMGDTVVIEQIGAYHARNDSLGGTDDDSDIVKSLEYFRKNKLKSSEPLFISVNVNSWGEGVHMVKEAIDALKNGENAAAYEFVLPSQMVAGIRTYTKSK